MLAAGFTIADIPERVTWRAVMVMAKHARPGSAYQMVMADADTQWPRNEQLLGILIDTVRDLTWVLQAVNTPEGKPAPDRPPRLPRPGVSHDDREVVDAPAAPPVITEPHTGIDIEGTYGHDPIPASEFEAWWSMGGG